MHSSMSAMVSPMPSTLSLPLGPLPATPILGKGEKAARDFEAQLIGMVMEPLERTFAALPGQEEVAGQDDYNYLGIQALSSSLAAAGGFGIARMISQQFERGEAAAAVTRKIEVESPQDR